MLRQADTIRLATGGAFTPAILPLSRFWHPTQEHIPNASAIEKALDAVSPAELKLPSTGWGEISSTTRLDLGGGAGLDYVIGIGGETLTVDTVEGWVRTSGLEDRKV